MSGISISNGKSPGTIANGNGTTNGIKNGNGPIVPVKNGGSVLAAKNGFGHEGIGALSAATENLDINNGVTTNSSWKDGIWSIGLINAKYKYLTAETFGFKINSNGGALKKKQIWFLEPAPAALASTASGGGPVICLRSHLGRYLAVDQYGNVTCDGTEKNAGSTFLIHVLQSNRGHCWTLQNLSRGYYLGAGSDKLTCTAKTATAETEFWSVHLGARPQVNLKSVGRKRYAQLSKGEEEEIYVDSNVPWGADTLFTLQFREGNNENGYALLTCNNKFLNRNGKVQEKYDKDCSYSVEYHQQGQLALKDSHGQYLAPIGSKAILKTRSTTVTKDELFTLEDSLPQAAFSAALNSRFVSVKQGVDLTANQGEISDNETFQLEFDAYTKRWYIRSMKDQYWTLESSGGIQATAMKKTSNALFELIWVAEGSVAFRGNNGKYVGIKRSGHLYANYDELSTAENNTQFYFYLVNRPLLVLKCEQGYVGCKTSNPTQLECNKASYETIQVERGSDLGSVHFKASNGKYWGLFGSEVRADTDTPTKFYIELREPTKICVKTTDGAYLNEDKNGKLNVSQSGSKEATQWEF